MESDGMGYSACEDRYYVLTTLPDGSRACATLLDGSGNHLCGPDRTRDDLEGAEVGKTVVDPPGDLYPIFAVEPTSPHVEEVVPELVITETVEPGVIRVWYRDIAIVCHTGAQKRTAVVRVANDSRTVYLEVGDIAVEDSRGPE